MNLDVLEDIGLTHGEIKVYIALLELGETNVGPLKKKIQMQNSVIHLCLNNLMGKGLVNYVEKGKRRYYRATNPENLIDFLNEKKRRLKQVLPILKEKQKGKVDYEVHIYEGSKGLRAIHEDILKELNKGDEWLVLGAPREAHEKFEPYFLDVNKRRVKKKINLRGLYKEESREFAKLREKMPFTKVKYLPESLSAPMWITIYNNKTILLVTSEITLGIVIENHTIARNFKEYFELVWKIANK